MSLVQATTALRFVERTITEQEAFTDVMGIHQPARTKKVRILQQSFQIVDADKQTLTREWRDVPLESE